MTSARRASASPRWWSSGGCVAGERPPRLLADYQQGAVVSLEQLMALAITDDHMRRGQAAVGRSVPEWQRRHGVPRGPPDPRRGGTPAAMRWRAPSWAWQTCEAAGWHPARPVCGREERRVPHRCRFAGEAGLRAGRSRAESGAGPNGSWVEVTPARVVRPNLTPSIAGAALHAGNPPSRRPNASEPEAGRRGFRTSSRLRGRRPERVGGARALHEELDRLGSVQLDATEQTPSDHDPASSPWPGRSVSVDPTGAVVVHRGPLREEQVKARCVRRRSRYLAAPAEAGRASAEAHPPCRGGLSEAGEARPSAHHRTAALCRPRWWPAIPVHRPGGPWYTSWCSG